MFSNLSSNSISFATDTPSLVIVGPPNDLSNTTLRPLGPNVTFTASASMFTPLSIFARASLPNNTSFAAIFMVPYILFCTEFNPYNKMGGELLIIQRWLKCQILTKLVLLRRQFFQFSCRNLH